MKYHFAIVIIVLFANCNRESQTPARSDIFLIIDSKSDTTISINDSLRIHVQEGFYQEKWGEVTISKKACEVNEVLSKLDTSSINFGYKLNGYQCISELGFDFLNNKQHSIEGIKLLTDETPSHQLKLFDNSGSILLMARLKKSYLSDTIDFVSGLPDGFLKASVLITDTSFTSLSVIAPNIFSYPFDIVTSNVPLTDFRLKIKNKSKEEMVYYAITTSFSLGIQGKLLDNEVIFKNVFIDESITIIAVENNLNKEIKWAIGEFKTHQKDNELRLKKTYINEFIDELDSVIRNNYSHLIPSNSPSL